MRAGLHAPAVSLAGDGFIHMIELVLRSSHQILAVLSRMTRKYFGKNGFLSTAITLLEVRSSKVERIMLVVPCFGCILQEMTFPLPVPIMNLEGIVDSKERLLIPSAFSGSVSSSSTTTRNSLVAFLMFLISHHFMYPSSDPVKNSVPVFPIHRNV